MTRASGIDVSHWQATTPPLAGLSFLIAKASEGGLPDDKYAMHIRNARAAGLVTGAYCFNRADLPMQYQVDTFVRAAGDVDLYFIDVEEENIAGNQRFTVAQTKDFMARFRAATGRRIGLYVSESPYVSGGYSQAGADYLWIAHYGVTQPAVVWDFHQYRGSPLDLNRYNGNAEELRRFAGGIMDWKIETAIPGYFTSTTATGAGWIDPETFKTHPMPPGERIYVMAQIHVGGQWNLPGYLCSDATIHGRIVLAGDGTFEPAPGPSVVELSVDGERVYP